MPRFSIVVFPGGDVSGSLRSIRRQSADRPEILTCNDGGPVARQVRDAVRAATGDFVGFVSAGDELTPRALEWAGHQIASDEQIDLLYTDQDRVGADGSIIDPFFKPDWSPERLLGHNYVGRLALFRRSTVEAVGGVRDDFGDAWEYDLVLRVATAARSVRHVSELVYRTGPASTPSFVPSDPMTRVALEQHIERSSIPAAAELDEHHGIFVLRPRLVDSPKVSIIIPAGGAIRRIGGTTVELITNCVRSVLEQSTYTNLEVIVVADRQAEPGIRASLADVLDRKVFVVRFDEPFNFARKINLGYECSSGDYLVLLNDDTAVIAPDWVESMLVFASQPGVGAVGAKLRNADSRYQHVGIVIVNGNPGHPYAGYPRDYPGYFDNALVPCNYLAVTGACLMTRRDLFEAVGGLSPKFPLNYNDVDYCLKVRHRGHRIVLAPAAELFHYESSSRGEPQVADEELERLYSRWASALEPDPYFSPHFLPSADYLTLVIPEGQTGRDLGVGVGSNVVPRRAR